MKNIKNIAYIIIAITTLIFSSCGDKKTEEAGEKHEEAATVAELTDSQVKTIGLTVASVVGRELSGTIKTTGKLDVPPQQLISVSIPFGGILKKINLLQGSEVSKGELIAVIENPEYIQMQQDYIEAKSQLDFAKSDYERQTDLAKENVNAQKTLQQSKSTYNTLIGKTNGLKAKLKILNLDIASIENGEIQSSINIYSPINGYCTQVNSNIGAFINPQDVIFKLADTQNMHAELTIFERDLPKIVVGQKVRFKLSNENKERISTVSLIGREIGADRIVQVHCNLSSADKDLLPGSYFTAIIETGASKVPTLPDEAIVNFEGKNYVFVYKGSENVKSKEGETETKFVYDMKEVEIGMAEDGYTELKNISADPKIQYVVKGAYSLLSKLKNSEEEE